MALNGVLTGAARQINGTPATGRNVDRVGAGNGAYSLGAPQQVERGLRSRSNSTPWFAVEPKVSWLTKKHLPVEPLNLAGADSTKNRQPCASSDAYLSSGEKPGQCPPLLLSSPFSAVRFAEELSRRMGIFRAFRGEWTPEF